MTDVLLGEEQKFGSINCGCHPNCGIGALPMVHKDTKEAVPVTKFLDIEQLLKDLRVIADSNRGKALSLAQLSMAIMRNYDASQAPEDLDLLMLIKQYLSQTGAIGMGVDDADSFPWRVLFIGGMWFQDLFNYDFRRTEMCIIPYGTQLGEISFCAYNTGIGWRNIIEQMYANASTKDWYKEKGRHKIYAGGRAVDMPQYAEAPEVKIPASAARAEREKLQRMKDAEAAAELEARKRQARKEKYERAARIKAAAEAGEATGASGAEGDGANGDGANGKRLPTDVRVTIEQIIEKGQQQLSQDPSRRGGANPFRGGGGCNGPRPTLK